MDEIIKKLRTVRGYKLKGKTINILCYDDDAVLVFENEDVLNQSNPW